LTNASFRGYDIRGTDLGNARGLGSAVFEDAIIDSRTRFPSEFRKENRGMKEER
jgi:hypothetical protein